MTHFSSFDESYPKVSNIPAWKQVSMVQKLEAVTKATQMGMGAVDFMDMERQEADLAAQAALHAPALERARLKAMGIEQPRTNWLAGLWPTARPAAA